jgi:TonB dependent receptor-like, beta-barrel/Carboxypeptidase regulatory-like domain
MAGISRLMTSAAAVGGLVLVCASSAAGAERATPRPSDSGSAPAGRVVSWTAGSIQGVVQDENGVPIKGAVVTALGTKTSFAVSDGTGRFELRTLPPGSYLLRAHLSGFLAPQGKMIEVRPSSRASSSIALRRAPSTTPSTTPSTSTIISGAATATVVLASSVGLPVAAIEPSSVPPKATGDADADPSPAPANDDHSETAWRLRHNRRSILQDATGLAVIDVEDAPNRAILDETRAGNRSPSQLAANLFSGTPFSGQLNLLTTSSFDNPQQLFSGNNFARSVAYISVGAPAGSQADWAVRGALSQADISSWVVAGTYSTRGPARHHYDIGLSYATQRYDGGNPAALRDVTDGSRNAGAMYGFDTFTMTPAIVLTFGGRYARYDYLDGKTLISPRVALSVAPAEHFRINAVASHRSFAPGAEEFLPPGDNGIWLPPQRTFSSLSGGTLEAERTTHLELGLERDLGSASAVTVRAFRQQVADQLVTMFGIDVPGLPPASLGHYFVGNYGDVQARGVSAGFRTIAGRVQGSVEYSLTRARWDSGDEPALLMLGMPSSGPLRAGRIHDVATSIETDVPETSTRVVVVYRVSNAFGHRPLDDAPGLDSRFGVQVHQSLPFLDFSTAKWEMLLGVRNFFREASADQSIYDELLVVRPPKRIVGGLTMRF